MSDVGLCPVACCAPVPALSSTPSAPGTSYQQGLVASSAPAGARLPEQSRAGPQHQTSSSTKTRPTAACSTLGLPRSSLGTRQSRQAVVSRMAARANPVTLMLNCGVSRAHAQKRRRFDAAWVGWCKWASGQVVVVVCAREGVWCCWLSKKCLAARARRRSVRTHLPPLTRRSTVVVGQSVSESVVVVRAR